MRIGIFGGAFNPVHNGHLKLMQEMIRFLNLDKLIVIPTSNPPHKSSEGLISGDDRIKMLKLAISSPDAFDFDYKNKIEISDIEFKSKEKSYTYNTLKKLWTPVDDFFLLVGSDQLLNFKSWYRYDDILSLASLCAVTREEGEREKCRQFLADNQKEFHNCTLLVYPPIVVSSTEIREMVKNGVDVSGFIPAKVKKFIIEKGLYSV